MTTTHVQSFALISMLMGRPKTPPSGDDLAVLDYHLKVKIFNYLLEIDIFRGFDV